MACVAAPRACVPRWLQRSLRSVRRGRSIVLSVLWPGGASLVANPVAHMLNHRIEANAILNKPEPPVATTRKPPPRACGHRLSHFSEHAAHNGEPVPCFWGRSDIKKNKKNTLRPLWHSMHSTRHSVHGTWRSVHSTCDSAHNPWHSVYQSRHSGDQSMHSMWRSGHSTWHMTRQCGGPGAARLRLLIPDTADRSVHQHATTPIRSHHIKGLFFVWAPSATYTSPTHACLAVCLCTVLGTYTGAACGAVCCAVCCAVQHCVMPCAVFWCYAAIDKARCACCVLRCAAGCVLCCLCSALWWALGWAAIHTGLGGSEVRMCGHQ